MRPELKKTTLPLLYDRVSQVYRFIFHVLCAIYAAQPRSNAPHLCFRPCPSLLRSWPSLVARVLTLGWLDRAVAHAPLCLPEKMFAVCRCSASMLVLGTEGNQDQTQAKTKTHIPLSWRKYFFGLAFLACGWLWNRA